MTTVPGQAAAGVVIAASPAAGARVAKGSKVTLKASKGQATVPDVRGQPAADAKGARVPRAVAAPEPRRPRLLLLRK